MKEVKENNNMTKHNQTPINLSLIILTILIISGVVWGAQEPEPINPSVTDNRDNIAQSNGSENKEDNKQKYEIDLSSDVDTSDWVTFQSDTLHFTVKYPPSVNITDRGIRDIFVIDEEKSSGFDYRNSFSVMGIFPVTNRDNPFNGLDGVGVVDEESITLNERTAIVRLENYGKIYSVLIHDIKRNAVFGIEFTSEFNADSESAPVYSKIFKAMLAIFDIEPGEKITEKYLRDYVFGP